MGKTFWLFWKLDWGARLVIVGAVVSFIRKCFVRFSELTIVACMRSM